MSKIQSGGYDLIAPFYDDGVGLLFGKGIFDAQIHFLSIIPDRSRILILGGGSGWLLVELFKRVSNPVVCYIDASEKMIELSKAKMNEQVEFICGTEENIPNRKFDYIITNFYLDGFSYPTLIAKIRHISQFLGDSNSKWIVTDFVETGKKKHKRILWFTHLFFRILIKHPNKELVNWQMALEEAGFKKIETAYFNQGFIQTVVYS
jgi:tRNA (cmo5U34)-methyltransferase